MQMGHPLRFFQVEPLSLFLTALHRFDHCDFGIWLREPLPRPTESTESDFTAVSKSYSAAVIRASHVFRTKQDPALAGCVCETSAQM